MQKNDRKHRRYLWMNLLTAGLIFASILTGMYFIGSRRIGQETYAHEIGVQKEFLKHSVDNICIDIDEERNYLEETQPELSEAEIRERIEAQLHARIHHETFPADAYMWVEQVVDYEGGDDYAIRIIHPNLPDSEGTSLSTNEKNAEGEYIYRDELEGVKKDGSVFQQYHFKELHSDAVTEKISYSKLYKDYDWIIGMGVNMDVMEETIGTTAGIIRPMMIRAVLILGVILVIVSVLLQRKVVKRETADLTARQKKLQMDLNWDQNTSANSRRYGEELLEEEVQKAKEGAYAAVLMMDVDQFKQYNDTYGHETGDTVLREVVKAFRRVTRTTDSIIRWGGDEFVCILRGVRPGDIPVIQEKVLASVQNISIGTGKITVSIGGTAVTKRDDSPETVVNRADAALYEAKKNGRNCASVR